MHLCTQVITYHIRCGICHKWWSTTDSWKPDTVHHCPWCGEKAKVEMADMNDLETLQSISLDG